MPINKHTLKLREKYFICATAVYDLETNKVIASLEFDYLSETIEESSDYIMEFINRKWPEPRYSGHALHVQEFYLSRVDLSLNTP